MSALVSRRLSLTISWPAPVLLVAAVMMSVALMGAASHGIPSPTASATMPSGQVSADLAQVSARSPQRVVEVIVQAQPGATPQTLASRIQLGGGSVLQEIPLINGLAARMTAADAVALAKFSGVRAVSLNARIVGQGALDPSKLQSAYIQSIRADKAWAGGDTGKGVGVAVIDSGLAGGLPDFRGADGHSRGIISAVVNPRTADAADSYGHGTHVAGLIAGNGFARSSTDPEYGRYAGVAPDANLIAIKADDGSGSTDVLSLIDGLQFAVSHKADYNIRVVNLSVRTASANSYKTDPLDAAAEATWMHGIVVVAAAGNLGTASDAVSHAPGNDPYVITVGGVDDMGTKDINDDQLASWSSRGVTQDGFAKPDVLAPGAHLVAPLAPNSYFSTACSSCLVDGGQYIRLGGTSMATGVVSGAVADIIQAHPDWTPNQIKATLVKRGRSVSDSSGSATGNEIALDKVLFTNNGSPEAPANQNLTPNSLIDPATGTINATDESWAASSWGASSWGASSWGASSWGSAPLQWTADWASASYTGTSLSPTAFDAGNPQKCWQLLRTGFSASSWGASSWGSDQLSAAHSACDAAASAAASGQASSWGASSWGASSWGASSWGASSWGASSWGASSWGGVTWATAFDK